MKSRKNPHYHNLHIAVSLFIILLLYLYCHRSRIGPKISMLSFHVRFPSRIFSSVPSQFFDFFPSRFVVSFPLQIATFLPRSYLFFSLLLLVPVVREGVTAVIDQNVDMLQLLSNTFLVKNSLYQFIVRCIDLLLPFLFELPIPFLFELPHFRFGLSFSFCFFV